MALGDVFFSTFLPKLGFRTLLFLDQGPLNSELVGDFQTFDWISQWLELLKREDEEEYRGIIFLLGFLIRSYFVPDACYFCSFYFIHTRCLSSNPLFLKVSEVHFEDYCWQVYVSNIAKNSYLFLSVPPPP